MKEITQDELDRRLKALNERLPVERGFDERVMARIRVDAITPHGEKDYQLWRFVMKGAIGIAASVVVGIAAWHFFVGEPRVAYGIDDLPQRMLALKSLHMKGMIYEQGGPGQPMEIWAERPNHARFNGHRGNETASTDEIISPEGRITIDETKKIVVIANERPVDAKLDTEQWLQEMQMLLMPQQTGLSKVRVETVNGVKADIYESRQTAPGMSVRVEVALNPMNGLPLRCAMYRTSPSGKEIPCLLFDVIEPNVAIPAETFVFHPPADYKVSHVEFAGVNVSMAGTVACATRYAIPINSKAILLCWACYDTKNPTDDLNLGKDAGVEIINSKNTPYQEHLLRADAAVEGYHWRWSLMTTEQPEAEFGRTLTVKTHAGAAKTTSTLMPVTLPPEELANVVEEAQRVTLPEGGKPMTLEEIQAVK